MPLAHVRAYESARRRAALGGAVELRRVAPPCAAASSMLGSFARARAMLQGEASGASHGRGGPMRLLVRRADLLGDAAASSPSASSAACASASSGVRDLRLALRLEGANGVGPTGLGNSARAWGVCGNGEARRMGPQEGSSRGVVKGSRPDDTSFGGPLGDASGGEKKDDPRPNTFRGPPRAAKTSMFGLPNTKLCNAGQMSPTSDQGASSSI